MASKQQAFLSAVFLIQKNSIHSAVSSRLLEERLNIDYKRCLKLAHYWEHIGAIKRLPVRGGAFELRLTPSGHVLAENTYHKAQRRKKHIALAGLIFIFIALTFLYYTHYLA